MSIESLRRRSGALQLAVFLVIAGSATAFFCRLTNHVDAEWLHVHSGFNPPGLIRELEQDRPEWILIGNSMLGSRVEETALGTASGRKTRVIYKPGSQSATWFLIFKQVVLESACEPAWVTFFFRNTDLTWSDFRIGGIQAEGIEAMSGPAQPEWRMVMKTRSKDSAGVLALRHGLDSLFPSRYLNNSARRYVQRRGFRLTRIGTDMNSTQRREEMNDRFSLDHLRHDLGSDTDLSAETSDAAPEGLDDESYLLGPRVFDPSPDRSFLPHIVSLAKKTGIRLHFHRVKRRTDSRKGHVEAPWLRDYMLELRNWLESQGCVMTDESNDDRLTADMYADGDHISSDSEVQRRYLEIFWDRTREIVKFSPPSN